MNTQQPFTITVHYDPCYVLPGQDPFQTWHERLLVQSWPDVEAVVDRILVRQGMVIPGGGEPDLALCAAAPHPGDRRGARRPVEPGEALPTRPN